jgi:hypothetical protein
MRALALCESIVIKHFQHAQKQRERGGKREVRRKILESEPVSPQVSSK